MDLQHKAEVSIQKALDILLTNLPAEEVLSVYAKGSYVHGSMNEESDVDLVVILRTRMCLPRVYELTEKYGNTTELPFGAVAYTLDELKTGELDPARPGGISPISGFVKNLDSLPLLYGERPSGELFTRTDKKDLQIFIRNFNTMWLPDLAEGKLSFNQFLKAVFWLTEAEQRVRHIPTEYSWTSIVNSVTDKGHVVHDALRLRLQKTITHEEELAFVEKLKEHLSALESLTA